MAEDRPALAEPEIEVTSAMIEAGVGAFCDFDERFESLQEMVERVYHTMAVTAAATTCVKGDDQF